MSERVRVVEKIQKLERYIVTSCMSRIDSKMYLKQIRKSVQEVLYARFSLASATEGQPETWWLDFDLELDDGAVDDCCKR